MFIYLSSSGHRPIFTATSGLGRAGAEARGEGRERGGRPADWRKGGRDNDEDVGGGWG